MLSIGIVGLPNVGKSTLFNALVKGNLAEASNYAFTTIDPNVGVVEVPDFRLQKLAEIEKSEKIIPTTIEFVDIAGLIKGASKGEGLGNKFLAHIREVDAILMVVRAFENSKITHVEGSINPSRDIETILTELALADISTIENRERSLEKEIKAGEKEASELKLVIDKIKPILEQGSLTSLVKLSNDEKKLLIGLGLLTLKPFIYAFNVSEPDAQTSTSEIIKNHQLESIIPKNQALVISAEAESQIAELEGEEKKEFLTELGLKESGLERLIKTGYETLGLLTFLTAGSKEARAWTVKKGAKAPEAAGKIHSDFEQKFIKVEVAKYQDFVELDGWKGVKEKGKMRLEGKDYIMQDGDVVYFHHS